jgi:predicted 2-oxoglutarate/Fe(II)-dependent dioxygenase YbiX
VVEPSAEQSPQAASLDEARLTATRERRAHSFAWARSVVRSDAASALADLESGTHTSTLDGQWLSDLVHGDAPAPRTLVDIFSSSVTRWPERLAVEDTKRRLRSR